MRNHRSDYQRLARLDQSCSVAESWSVPQHERVGPSEPLNSRRDSVTMGSIATLADILLQQRPNEGGRACIVWLIRLRLTSQLKRLQQAFAGHLALELRNKACSSAARPNLIGRVKTDADRVDLAWCEHGPPCLKPLIKARGADACPRKLA